MNGPEHAIEAQKCIDRGMNTNSFELFVAAQAHATLALTAALVETPGALGGNPNLGEWLAAFPASSSLGPEK